MRAVFEIFLAIFFTITVGITLLNLCSTIKAHDYSKGHTSILIAKD
ncbi:MAG: hypothetical protein ISR65_07315 [Bacteriovoracaceae bacterium]|nr:hypothetical protein [Bacteriovoracaceae bacterium]